jgi:single-stranded-DNA-specific exonuclease
VDDYHEYALPLAAIATLGDYMQLNLENRAIAVEGFDRIAESGLPGLIAAADHCDVTTVRDLSWSLAPFLNAAQEDESGEAMVELLLAQDGGKIVRLLNALDEWREERRQERKAQQRHLEECLEAQADPAEDRILVVETEQYVGGGPLNRISEEWGRPVLTYRENGETYRGGGRTDPDIDFLELYAECDSLLAEYWGHPGAAGFETETSAIEDFEQAIRKALRENYEPADLRPTVDIDRRLQPTDVDQDLVDAIERLRPFGPGNPEPKFLVEDTVITERRLFGDGDCHVALVPDSASFEITCWNGSEDGTSFEVGESYDFVGTLGIDDYTAEPTLTVDDYQPVEAS